MLILDSDVQVTKDVFLQIVLFGSGQLKVFAALNENFLLMVNWRDWEMMVDLHFERMKNLL